MLTESVGQLSCLEQAKTLSKPDSVISFLEKCLPSLRKDTSNYVNSVIYLAKQYNRKSQFAKAEHYFKDLQNWLGSNSNLNLQGAVMNQLGNVYHANQDNAAALKSYLQSVQWFMQTKNLASLISVYTDIAEFYRSMANYSEARNYIKKGFKLYRETKQTQLPVLIRLYNRYAAIENENNEIDSSMYFSSIAIKLSKQIGDKYSEAVSFNELGYSLKNRKMVDSSFNCYQRAINLWDSVGAEAEAVYARFNQARLLAHNDYPVKKVIPYYKDVIRIVKEKQINYWLDEVYFELSSCYSFLGDSLNSLRYKAASLNEAIQRTRAINDARVNDIKEKYENQRYKNEIIKVTGELERAEVSLMQKKRENLIIYIFLFLLGLFVIIIVLLSVKISKSNKMLKLKNKEKDSLIQEIHHRVKNNLQFVSSLINMQINSSQNQKEKDSLYDASRRIRSMALVHEMLYNHKDLSGIGISKYLSELVSSLSELVNSNNKNVKFKLDCDEILFNVPSSLAIGMITSELVSNSMKHAFEGISDPLISISLKMDPKTKDVTLVISDNGIGKANDEGKASSKLGMRLIDIFSRQLKGNYEFNNDRGLQFILNFNYKY